MSLLSQASLVVVPSGYKEDVVYSVKPTDGSGDLTFTRASDGTRVNSQGLVERVPWNLLQQSNAFSTTWTKFGSVLTGGQSGYDGSSNAWLLSADTPSIFSSRINQAVSVSGALVFSVYAKAETLDWILLDAVGTNGFGAWFDVNNGVKGQVTSTSIGSKITSVGNGWYRCEVFGNATTLTEVRIYVTDGNGTTAANDGDGVYIQNAQLNEGSTAKPYFPTTDRLNVPRLDYSNGCPSLLLEPQRTNLLTYSEQFDNAGWDKTSGGAAITANSEISPDGTQNADIITGTGSSVAFVLVRRAVTVPSASTYTFSGFFKYNNHPFVSLNLAAYDGGGSAYFNIQTGVVGTVSAGASATITNYGNGWYRCTLTASIGASDLTGRPSIYVAYEDGTSDFPSTAAASGKAAYAWGAQLEAGSYATSYIPTTSASVTRVADATYKTGISSLIGQSEGTIFVEFDQSLIGQSATRRIFALSDGTTNNRITAYINSGNKIDFYVRNSGGDLFLGTASTAGNTKGVHKIAAVYKDQDYAFYFDGSSIISGTGTAGTIPACSRFDLANQLGANDLYEPINQAVLFKTRLTNAELAAITTL